MSDVTAEHLTIVLAAIPTDRYVDMDLLISKLKGTKMEGCTALALVSVLDQLLKRDVIEYGVDARYINKKVVFFRRKG
jgi:hypothetical protein